MTNICYDSDTMYSCRKYDSDESSLISLPFSEIDYETEDLSDCDFEFGSFRSTDLGEYVEYISVSSDEVSLISEEKRRCSILLKLSSSICSVKRKILSIIRRSRFYNRINNNSFSKHQKIH